MNVGSRLANRDGALLAPLAEDFDVSARADRHILTLQARRLRQAETGLQGRQQQRVVPAADPGILVRCLQRGIDLGARQDVDQLAHRTSWGPRQSWTRTPLPHSRSVFLCGTREHL